ncbi:Hypothetical predicted protein [Octopus vulgaris]|uniref:Receptor ligand binding region domain-containing protein n=1 Tax=Octopus vulgaris TaxID=6645 RepID=A0AA36B2N9_OCTVU|nr:Hypothetical predicted protein [Octopus vulgaris]
MSKISLNMNDSLTFDAWCLPKKILNIAVILPDDNAYPFSIDRVKPGLSIAVKTIKTLELLSDNYDLHVNYANSRCSFVYPINEAIKFYVRKELDVIFGPFCDYAAAPLARQITFWSIPMLTAGAMAADFASNAVIGTGEDNGLEEEKAEEVHLREILKKYKQIRLNPS